MNQINGYCQIELPDRIALDALKGEGVTLTDAEVKPIIKALNLDGVKKGDDYSSYINVCLNKPIIVRAHTMPDVTKRYVKSIFHASFILDGTLLIELQYQDVNEVLKHVTISISTPSETSNWDISIYAVKITTTEIA